MRAAGASCARWAGGAPWAAALLGAAAALVAAALAAARAAAGGGAERCAQAVGPDAECPAALAAPLGGDWRRAVVPGAFPPVVMQALLDLAPDAVVLGDGYGSNNVKPLSASEFFGGASPSSAAEWAASQPEGDQRAKAVAWARTYVGVARKMKQLVEARLSPSAPLSFDFIHLSCRERDETVLHDGRDSHPEHADNCYLNQTECVRDASARHWRSHTAHVYLHGPEGGDFEGDTAAKSAAEHARIAAADRLRLRAASSVVKGVAMWISAVGAALDGAAVLKQAAPPRLQCDLRGPAGARLCARCRWMERASDCLGSIVAAALDCNKALPAKGELPHVLVQLAPAAEAALQRDMPLVACLVCGGTGAVRSSSFVKCCGEPGAKGMLAISRLAEGLAPGVSARVAVAIEKLDYG
ncbi:unnamed protein product [Prorocentrum cordatum]|uniref:Uncharacterized protein n=1 Tax=Prorocentrum cordatum TaxID=2364126 RepID=A0ABN9RM02_9DINO|nr:unnamed protein product [Polarella glacialis]